MMHDYSFMEVKKRRGLGLSARRRDPIPPEASHIFDIPALQATAAEPFVGVTEDGSAVPGLFSIGTSGASTVRIVQAANRLLGMLTRQQLDTVSFGIDAVDWRTWFNIHPNIFRHGLLLEDLGADQREAALDVVASTMSLRGFANARGIMRINDYLLDLLARNGDHRTDEYGEWAYFFSLFGHPSADQPWGWQLDGHHLNLNCFVLGDQIVFTPSFMGSEPMIIAEGRYAGTSVLEAEGVTGLALARTLTESQSRVGAPFASILPGRLPADRVGGEGQMLATAFRDNRHLRREGISATDLSTTQRDLLREAIRTYVGWAAEDHAAAKMREVDRHLSETNFLWMGDQGDGPFYYRIHSPVILIEYNHQAGTFFTNKEPTRIHTHTVMRTPNGNDYGKDLLRQHHEQFIHTADGRHIPRNP